ASRDGRNGARRRRQSRSWGGIGERGKLGSRLRAPIVAEARRRQQYARAAPADALPGNSLAAQTEGNPDVDISTTVDIIHLQASRLEGDRCELRCCRPRPRFSLPPSARPTRTTRASYINRRRSGSAAQSWTS